MESVEIFVTKDHTVAKCRFNISIIGKAAKSGKLIERQGTFSPKLCIKYKITEELIKRLLPIVLKDFDYAKIFRTQEKLEFQKIKGALNRKLVQIQNNKGGKKWIEGDYPEKKDSVELHPEEEVKVFKQQGLRSFFDHDDNKDWAHSQLLFATSFGGKTSWVVDQLNKLNYKDAVVPDIILLFTESVNAAPLRNIHSNIKAKMQIFDRFCPSTLQFLVKLQKALNNHLKILVILDDVISQLKSTQVKKMFLTLRNSNINAMVSIQDPMLVSPDARMSVHDIFIIKLKQPRWKYMLDTGLDSEMRQLTGVGDNIKGNKLAEVVTRFMKDKILHYDQRKDEVHLIEKDN